MQCTSLIPQGDKKKCGKLLYFKTNYTKVFNCYSTSAKLGKTQIRIEVRFVLP